MEIGEIGILKGLEDEHISKVIKHFRCRSFKRSEVLQRASDKQRGADHNDVCFILSGRVKEATVTLSGKEIIFNILKEDNCIGLIPALYGTSPYQSEFTAITDGKIVAISSQAFSELMSNHPSISRAILSELSKNIINLSARLYELRALDVSQRTRVEVLRHAVPAYAGARAMFTFLPTHEEIANCVFSHREAVTKELSCLKKMGLIQKHEGQLYIPDAQKLEGTLPELPSWAYSA